MVSRYTLTLPLMGLALLANSQWVRTRPSNTKLQPAHAQEVKNPHVQGTAKAGGDIVWSEDFANGLAGNNGTGGAWLFNGQDANLWKYSTTGPSGAYSDAAAELIDSDTDENGFMIFLADSGNTDWSVVPPVAFPVAQFLNWNASLESPTLDLSATPYVRIEFIHAFRFCCGSSPFFVEVSTDGGNNWPASFEVSNGAAVNAGTNITSSVNIADAISGNPANVKFRFRFAGEDVGTSHYYWQVDDVRIVELYEYDLSMTSAAQTAWDPATAVTYDSLRYSIYPYGQLRPVGLNMTVLNNGSLDQAPVTANFLVEQGGNTVLDQDQTIANFPAGETQTIFVSPDFVPPATTGTYDVTYSISSGQVDNTPDDNDGSASFKVDDFTYARDLGTVAGYEEGTGLEPDQYELCNGFHIANATELIGIDVALRSGGSNMVGLLITGTLRAGDLTTLIDQTIEHEIVTADLNGANGSKFITLMFAAPQPLDAGSDYVVCIQHFGGAVLRTGTNGVSEEQSSFIYYNGSAGLDWYYTTTTPMVRMNFDPAAGIAESERANGVGLGQNMPNPADQNTAVVFDLDNSAQASLELHDLSGSLVRSINLGNRSAGVHRITVDTSDLTDGVYFYTLQAGNERQSKRMVVMH
ncbi:MAG: T9SS type A sorting domain-containing protein [Flavobacteriales bacterium]|nr:T9SS type A sorting domain-containing protein [Flavobacteriales bacterium]